MPHYTITLTGRMAIMLAITILAVGIAIGLAT